MKVTICPDGLTARSESGKIFIIQSLVITRKHSALPTLYEPSDPIFKAICAPNTIHRAIPLSARKINII